MFLLLLFFTVSNLIQTTILFILSLRSSIIILPNTIGITRCSVHFEGKLRVKSFIIHCFLWYLYIDRK